MIRRCSASKWLGKPGRWEPCPQDGVHYAKGFWFCPEHFEPLDGLASAGSVTGFDPRARGNCTVCGERAYHHMATKCQAHKVKVAK